MSPAQRHIKKHANARQRRHLTAQERLERDRRQAQQAAQALEQALEDLGLPEVLVAELEGRLRSQRKLLAKLCGMMFPPLFGCRTDSELCRVRGWDKHFPSRLLSALPKRSWLKQLRRLGLEVLVLLWRHVQDKSPATRSRWQWTWVGDDSVFKKYGKQLGLVSTWWSGQEHRVLSGIDGVLRFGSQLSDRSMNTVHLNRLVSQFSLSTVVVQPSELSSDPKAHAAGMSNGVLVAADRWKGQLPLTESTLMKLTQHLTVSDLQIPWREFPQNAGCLPPELPYLILLAQKRRAVLEILEALLDLAPRCGFPLATMNISLVSLAAQKFPEKSLRAILTFSYSLVN